MSVSVITHKLSGSEEVGSREVEGVNNGSDQIQTVVDSDMGGRGGRRGSNPL